MSAYQTKFHRDGTVTVWDVYQQQWVRRAAADLIAECGSANALMPTLSQSERDRITRMAANA